MRFLLSEPLPRSDLSAPHALGRMRWIWHYAMKPSAGEVLPWSAGLTRPEKQARALPPALMFVGSINADLRSILAGLAPAWRGLPVFVGWSGNFAAEHTAPVERT